MTGPDKGGRGPIGPDDIDWFTREATDGLRRMVGQFVESQLRDKPIREPRPTRPDPAPATDGGVWAIVVDDGASDRVHSLYASELDALRANADNVDPRRTVRFLVFGEPVE
ncbi:hypothetical protein [Gordonia humi]|uniref:Uncharacterized protein n=1 Tax=Gordonia humi TaxID=686429 RepID=A0A840F607_9ACTN|nr:hypothetical protein [Gordonia humi]MBB4137326.1 hypothetical protein [Gordonia humi]